MAWWKIAFENLKIASIPLSPYTCTWKLRLYEHFETCTFFNSYARSVIKAAEETCHVMETANSERVEKKFWLTVNELKKILANSEWVEKNFGNCFQHGLDKKTLIEKYWNATMSSQSSKGLKKKVPDNFEIPVRFRPFKKCSQTGNILILS